VSCPRNEDKNFVGSRHVFPLRHSGASQNPGGLQMDFGLRRSDSRLITYL
jgi:hypothetical protein